MKKIALRGKYGIGKYALVDDCDYELLAKKKWFLSGKYVVSSIYNKDTQKTNLVLLHRIIMNPSPNLAIDHINRNTLDNRRSNLRICNQGQNASNRPNKRNTSGYRGVQFHKKSGTWIAIVGLEYIGKFTTIEEAARVRDLEAIEKWGEFAELNFPLQTYQ